MEINTNLGAGGVPGITPPQRSATAAKAATDGVSLDNSAALDGALAQTPDARPDAVENARKLIADTNYPPLVTIQKFSALLAIHFDSDAS